MKPTKQAKQANKMEAGLIIAPDVKMYAKTRIKLIWDSIGLKLDNSTEQRKAAGKIARVSRQDEERIYYKDRLILIFEPIKQFKPVYEQVYYFIEDTSKD